MASVSIAICTCNGALYLDDQLSSITSQTRPPDEVVIGDDDSEDETVTIIQRFAAIAPYPVRIIQNDTRLGVRRNFETVISHCSHELIALCDQDDVWMPEKLEVVATRFEDDPGAMAVFSDAIVVDDALRPLGYTMWEQIGFSRERRKLMLQDRPWEVLFKDPVVTGATLAFRRNLVSRCLPIPENWMHDAWIAQIAASHGRLLPVEASLIKYRQHASNVIGGRRLSLLNQIRQAQYVGRSDLVEREWSRYTDLLERLPEYGGTPRLATMRTLTVEKIGHLFRRKNLPRNRLRRAPTIISECLNGNYRRFAKDWRNVAADLFMS